MADRFSRAGIPSLAVSGLSDPEARDSALKRLKSKDVNVLFAVDLYNEGVDVPEIDTVLFLRPTESVTVFLQQLGRGLRLSDNKSGLTVLDFIGQQHRRFRFDVRFQAVTGATRQQLERQIEEGFPFLPSGCNIQLDRVAKEVILTNVKQAIGSSRSTLIGELRSLGDVDLKTFLNETGSDLTDVYRSSSSWSALRRQAGFHLPKAGPREKDLQRAMSRFLHIDDPERITTYQEVLEDQALSSSSDERVTRLLTMLHYSLWQEPMDSLQDSIALLKRHPAIVDELGQLLDIADDVADHMALRLTEDKIPLHVHSKYSRDEVLAAMGQSTVQKSSALREGVRWDQRHQTDLFFVTLNKSDRDYSPTTMYRDYALSPELFHWESQSTTSADSPTGQRYIDQRARRSNVFLFVRQDKRTRTGASPYLFLGAADYVSHTGSKPMAITWRLRKAMPPDFFQSARSVA